MAGKLDYRLSRSAPDRRRRTRGHISRSARGTIGDRLAPTPAAVSPKHLGATPVAVVQTRRLHFAKTLIDQTDLPFTQAALASGFGSIRRFNASFRTLYDRTPSELRRLAHRSGGSRAEHYRFQLPFRPPLDWEGLLGFLAPRAIPGVEAIDANSYRRTISIQGKRGTIEVSLGRRLELSINFPDVRALIHIVDRVRRLFDLRADPSEIHARLTHDPLLSGLHPGLRVPGRLGRLRAGGAGDSRPAGQRERGPLRWRAGWSTPSASRWMAAKG